MQVGDLVRIKSLKAEIRESLRNKAHVVTWVGQWHVHLHGFDPNQVHSIDDLEVISASR